MQDRKVTLLLIDAIINLVLGALLMFGPRFTIELFGLPETGTYFYASILGAVLFGIGFALVAESFNNPRIRGLGLVGAIAINFIGAGAVAVWLVIDPFDMPPRGYVTLWTVVVLVFGIGVVEIGNEVRNRGRAPLTGD